MSKKLAIRGHLTRGKEVIKLLEIMGGHNGSNLWGNETDYAYFITDSGDIGYRDTNHILTSYFTLEEFLEKYPFKIGDKVIDKADGCPGIVCEMKWDKDVSDMEYFVVFGNGIDFGWFTSDTIEFCKETDTVKPVTNKSERTHEDVIFDSIIWHLRNSVNNGNQTISGGKCEDYFREVVKKNNENKMKNILDVLFEHIKTTPKEELEKEFNELEEWSHVGPTVEEFMDFCDKINKKPKYPTTYEECCQHLGCDDKLSVGKLIPFQKLINARNAYRKIVGEEIGLDKPWEPDWKDETQVKYMITTFNNKLEFFSSMHSYVVGRRNHILSFPTEKMRDAFYENFKDLIESCKELM